MTTPRDVILDRIIAYASVEARLGYLCDDNHEDDAYFHAEAYHAARAAVRAEITKLRKQLEAEDHARALLTAAVTIEYRCHNCGNQIWAPASEHPGICIRCGSNGVSRL